MRDSRGSCHGGEQKDSETGLGLLVIPTKTLEKSTLGSVYSRTLTASEILNM